MPQLFAPKVSRLIRHAFVASLTLSFAAGCANQPQENLQKKPAKTHQEIVLDLAPESALRPGSEPWGGVVVDSANGKLLAAALHEDNALAVWVLDKDRNAREIGMVQVGYHPDSVTSLGDNIVAVAVEGAGLIGFWRISESVPPVKLGELKSPFPTREIVAQDLDQDGRQDLILAPYKGDKVAVLWGLGGNTQFSPPQFLQAAAIPWHPRVVDWNQDKRPDLLWSDWDTGSARLYLNEGGRKFKLEMLQPAQAGAPRQTGVGDVNADGKPDAVMAMSTGGKARILLNQGTNAPAIEDVPAPAWGYVSAEVLADGTLVLGEESRVILARKEQAGWVFRQLPAGSLPTPILVNDIDSDGHQDLVILHSAGGGMTLTYGPLWDKATPVSIAPSAR